MRIRRKDLSRIIQEELRRVLREGAADQAASIKPSLSPLKYNVGKSLRFSANVRNCISVFTQSHVGEAISGWILVKFDTDAQGKSKPGSVVVELDKSLEGYGTETSRSNVKSCIRSKMTRILKAQTFTADVNGIWKIPAGAGKR